MTRYPRQPLLCLQGSDKVQQAQRRLTTRWPLQTQRVINALTEHLQAAANPQQLAAITQMAGNCLIPAVLAQKSQISTDAFGTRQNDQIRRGNRLARANELQVDLRVQT